MFIWMIVARKRFQRAHKPSVVISPPDMNTGVDIAPDCGTLAGTVAPGIAMLRLMRCSYWSGLIAQW